MQAKEDGVEVRINEQFCFFFGESFVFGCFKVLDVNFTGLFVLT